MERTAPVEATTVTAPQDSSAFAESLPDELGETDPAIRKALKWLVKRLGEPLCADVLREASEIEANGGLWLVKEKRRRTKGGVFLTLMRERSAEARKLVRRVRTHPPGGDNQAPGEGGQLPGRKPFQWEQRGALAQEALRLRGQAMTAKTTLIGRPGNVVEHGDFVVTSMEVKSLPPLPKGLPAPAAPRVTYTLFIAAKQWQKVASALRVPDDQLIVEGFCLPDAETGGLSLLVLSSTTKALQRQKLAAMKGPKDEAAWPAMGPMIETRSRDVMRSAPMAAPPPPAAPTVSDEEQARTLLRGYVAKGQTFETIAMRSGLPLNRLREIHDGLPTTLSPAQIRTFLQRLRQALR